MSRPRSFGGDGGMGPIERRAWWTASLDHLAELGDRVGEGGALTHDEAFDATGLVMRVGETRFPLVFKSASCAAEGFRLIARGFMAAEVPELKRALGVAMAAAARACRRLIEIDTEQQAAAQRRRYGED